MLFVSCVCRAFASVHCCPVVTCLDWATPWLSFVMLNCVFVTFRCGILGQVWYLILSIPDFATFLTVFLLYVGLVFSPSFAMEGLCL